MQTERRPNNVSTAEKYKGKFKETSTSKEVIKQKNKERARRKKRLIIRNLSFQVTKEDLIGIFSKFGKVIDVNIPVKNDGKKRGFAFVQYEDTKSLIQAMKVLNNTAIHGRCVAIDYAIDKTSYQLKLQNIRQENATPSNKRIKKEPNSDSEDESVKEDSVTGMDEDEAESLDENERRANEFLKEFDSGMDDKYNEAESSEESSSSESEDVDEESEEEEDLKINKKSKDNKKFKQDSSDNSLNSPKKQFINKKKSNDVSEGKTIFLRNVSFITSNDSLAEAMEKYGECEYCVICIDPLTDHPKGTAFVKFKDKEGFDKLMQESFNEPGIMVDGRKLICSPAVSKETISDQQNEQKKPKDKRNLNLLKVGLIMPDSEESKEVSPADMVKRTQLEHFKKQKLKNVNFFVSDKRLMVHNLPRTMNDSQLRKLFKEASGKGAVITEARVMKEFKKTNSEGVPLSKGFGFVSFDKHEDALKALTELNNNPNTFTSQKRPIVEFSVENKVALLSKERRSEKIKQRNKKRSEEKQQRRLNKTFVKKEPKPEINEELSKKKVKKKLKQIRKPRNDMNKDHKADSSFNSESVNAETKQKKQKRKQKFQKKENKAKPSFSSQENFSNMVNKFKEKLLNKI